MAAAVNVARVMPGAAMVRSTERPGFSGTPRSRGCRHDLRADDRVAIMQIVVWPLC